MTVDGAMDEDAASATGHVRAALRDRRIEPPSMRLTIRGLGPRRQRPDTACSFVNLPSAARGR